LSRWIGKAKQIAEPPAPPTSKAQTPDAHGHEPLVQFNVKVRASVKKRVKQLAARDDIKLEALLARMVDLYEKEYGALPDAADKKR
jgi:hypothetical protein